MDDASKLDSDEHGWKRREDWSKGEIRYFDRYNVASIMIGLGGAVLLFGLAALVIAVMIWVRTGNFDLFWIVWAILLIFVGSRFLQIGLTRRSKWQRYGDSVFYMSDVPGVIGGSITGVVQTGKNVDSPEGFRVGFCCREFETSSEPGPPKVLWDAERMIHGDLQFSERGGTSIPVMFAIPFDVLESNHQTKKGVVQWTLSVRSLSNSADYFSEFEVPVFRTSQSDPLHQLDETVIKTFELPIDLGKQYVQSGILQHSLDDGGIRFEFSRCRHKTFAATLALFQLFVSLFVVLPLIILGSSTWPFVAGFMGLLMIPTLADLYLQHSRVDCTSHEIEVRSGKLYLGSPRQISACNIKSFEARDRGSTTDNFHQTTQFYHLFVNLNDGTQILFAKRVFPQSVAFDIVRRLETHLGIREDQERKG